MISAPKGRPVPSPGWVVLSPHLAVEPPKALSSDSVEPRDVVVEQHLLRSDTAGSDTSTATTLIDGGQSENIELSPPSPASRNTLSLPSLPVHYQVDESISDAVHSLRPIPKAAVCPPPLPAGKDGVYDNGPVPIQTAASGGKDGVYGNGLVPMQTAASGGKDGVYGNGLVPTQTAASGGKDGVYGNGIVPMQTAAPEEPVLPFTKLGLKSLLMSIPRKNLIKNLCSFVGCVCGIVSTIAYTYRSYMISLWQAEQAFYDHCREWVAEPDELGFSSCALVLQEALRPPPYVRYPDTMQHAKRGLPPTSSWSSENWKSNHFVPYLLLSHALFCIVCAIFVLCCLGYHRRRRAPLWDYDTAPSSQQESYHSSHIFRPGNVRTHPMPVSTLYEHLDATTYSGWPNNCRMEKHLANSSHKRRAIQAVAELACNEDNTTTSMMHPSLAAVEQEFTYGPAANDRHLPSISADHFSAQDKSEAAPQSQTALPETKRRPATPFDRWKGSCDGERVLPFSGSKTPFGFVGSKIDSKHQRSSGRALLTR